MISDLIAILGSTIIFYRILIDDMLTEQEQNEIRAAVKHEHDARSACPEALKIMQKYRGWVSDEGVQDVAAALAMTADEVDAIATAYNLIFRRPVGGM